MALTQTQFADEVAERAGLTRAEAKRALVALEEVILEEIGNAEKVKIAGVVQLTVRVKPATKARLGRNPATGEEITIDYRLNAFGGERSRCRCGAPSCTGWLVNSFFALDAARQRSYLPYAPAFIQREWRARARD